MFLAVWAAPWLAMAQAQSAQSEAAPAPAAVREPIKAVVRGFYVEARVGGGYMVKNAEVEPDATYPTLCGGDALDPKAGPCSERLGAGALVSAAVGFDLTDFLSIEAVGGLALVSSRREDRVRDLGLLFGGGGARVAVDLSDRVDLVLAGGAGFVQADNSVDPIMSGAAAYANLGLEYYVHVRHFSVGIVVSGLAPLDPQRIFVAVAPQLKYTF